MQLVRRTMRRKRIGDYRFLAQSFGKRRAAERDAPRDDGARGAQPMQQVVSARGAGVGACAGAGDGAAAGALAPRGWMAPAARAAPVWNDARSRLDGAAVARELKRARVCAAAGRARAEWAAAAAAAAAAAEWPARAYDDAARLQQRAAVGHGGGA
ncbi:Rhs element Vgr family protein [Gracilaria domingensis]|nr:Rhs element Vgr family protein [Gracilaria domingensis]